MVEIYFGTDSRFVGEGWIAREGNVWAMAQSRDEAIKLVSAPISWEPTRPDSEQAEVDAEFDEANCRAEAATEQFHREAVDYLSSEIGWIA